MHWEPLKLLLILVSLRVGSVWVGGLAGWLILKGCLSARRYSPSEDALLNVPLPQFQFLFDVNESFRRANKAKSMEISKTNCNLLFIARRCMTRTKRLLADCLTGWLAGCFLFPSSIGWLLHSTSCSIQLLARQPGY